MFSSDLSALGVPGFAMAPPDFERSVNPILTMQGGRLCPPYYDVLTRIFRPSYGPVVDSSTNDS